MEIALIDDDTSLLQSYTALINEALISLNLSGTIHTFSCAEEFLFEHPISFPYNCLFIDIQMKQVSGIQLAETIRKYDKDIILIFLTSTDQFVFKGYEVNAFRYFMKPITLDQICNVLKTIKEPIKRNEIILKVDGEIVKIYSDEIQYIESQQHYLLIQTKTIRFKIKENISDFMKLLNSDFIQPHRSYIVNISQITKITKTSIYLISNIEIPVSRNRINFINSEFIKFNMRDKL
jgi:DNA-binding LytR/AlgR family response regulator